MLFKREKKFNSEEEMYTFFVRMLLLLCDIKLQPKVENIFRYFVQYGISPAVHEKIIEDKVVPTVQSIFNAKTDLLNVGLLERSPKWKLAAGLEKVNISEELNIMIKCQKQIK